MLPVANSVYGVLVFLGFVAGLFCLVRLSKRAEIPARNMIDLSILLFVTGWIGARVLFVLIWWKYFISESLAVFYVWEGGFVFYGGLLLAAPFGIWFAHKKGISPWGAADVVFPSVVLGHAIGRVGCYVAGCCHGKLSEAGWMHPVQLYEAFSLLVLFGALIWLCGRRKFSGQVAAYYLMGYSVIRFVTEFFRGDSQRGLWFEGLVSTSQVISVVVLCFAAVFYLRESRRLT